MTACQQLRQINGLIPLVGSFVDIIYNNILEFLVLHRIDFIDL